MVLNNKERQTYQAYTALEPEAGAKKFSENSNEERQDFRLNYILSQFNREELRKIKEYLILQQGIENKHTQMLKDNNKKKGWEEAKNNMEYMFHINEIIKADFNLDKIDNPEISQSEIDFVKKIYKLRLGALNKKERQKLISQIQFRLDKQRNGLDKLTRQPRFYATTEMKKARSMGYYPYELVGEDEEKLHRNEYIEKNDKGGGKDLKQIRSKRFFLAKQPTGGNRSKEKDYIGIDEKRLVEAAAENTATEPLSQEEMVLLKEKYGEDYEPVVNNEDELLETIDKSTAVQEKLAKQALAEKFLSFLEKYQHRFADYRHYFEQKKAYLKDIALLRKRLEDNRNWKDLRKRVNARALRSELKQMENYLKRLEDKVNLASTGLSAQWIEKIVNMSPDELKAFEQRLVTAASPFDQTERENKNSAADKISA